MVLFDTHAHYDDVIFDADRDELLSGLPGKNIGLVLNAASDLKSAEKTVEMAEKYSFIYAAVGIHPNEAAGDPDLLQIRKMAGGKKVSAIGEIGLDYHYGDVSRETQKKVFDAQLDIALELDLPVIIHSRDAHKDSLDAVKRHKGSRGVFHCFSGSPEMAMELVGLGFYISFAGPITFSNARRAVETARCMPGDRILIETDCPYLAPVPFRGRRNDSGFLIYTAEKLAHILDTTVEEICEMTYRNGRRLFGI
jgi:TatD DNase family protein